MDLINIKLEDTAKFFQETHGYNIQQAFQGDLSMEFVPVDMRSLQAYINTVQGKILEQKNLNNNRSQTMLIQLAQARTIQALVLETGRQLNQYIPDRKKDYYKHFMVQFTGNSDFFGRVYNTGFSLQNVRSEVRVAALGKCYEYDISACVFSVYAHLASEHGVDTPSFSMYVKHKDKIRDDVAHELKFNSTHRHKLNVAKTAINAIGFGAGKSTGRWDKTRSEWVKHAIAEIILSPSDREAFFNHPFVSRLLADIQTLANVVSEHIDPELYNRRELRTDTERGYGTGRFNKKKYLAYLYQQAETMIMDHVLAGQQQAEIILRVHDAVYSRTPICVDALNYDAQQLCPWIRYEEKQHIAWFDKEADERAARIEQQNRDQLKAVNDNMLKMALEAGYTNRYSPHQDWEQITHPTVYRLAQEYQQYPDMCEVIQADEQYGEQVRKIMNIRLIKTFEPTPGESDDRYQYRTPQ